MKPHALLAALLLTACGLGVADVSVEGEPLDSAAKRLTEPTRDTVEVTGEGAVCTPYGRFECFTMCFDDDNPPADGKPRTFNVVVCADDPAAAERQALDETCGRLTTGSYSAGIRCKRIR